MPDNDIIYTNLQRRWIKSAQQLCQWTLGIDYIADRTINALCKTVKAYGNPPINLISESAQHFSNISQQSNRFTNWAADRQIIHEHGYRIGRENPKCSSRGINLAKDACLGELNGLQQGSFSQDYSLPLTRKYLTNIYEADYEAKLQSKIHHYENVDRWTVCQRLSLLRPYIDDGIDYMATKIVAHGDVAKLRKPRQTKRHVDLHAPLI